ncbi:MAG TPA: DUF58 domain-containing protein [Roseimicrobium sp.]|nr:DUF58 domain-containing protein [Roseimicrobium sp.]
MSEAAPAMKSGADTTRWIHPASLMSIRNLELRARVVVEGFWNGLHRSPYHGFSVEFTEYRQYTPGDDPRYLDWKLYARSDRYFIKKFEDETNLRCNLLVDGSRSMTYGSTGWSKAEYAHTLAATLAFFLQQQGDAVGVMTFDDQIRDYLPARNRPGHLRQLMLLLEKPAGGRATDISAPLRRISEIVSKRGMMVLVSDFLAPIETLEANLALIGARGHDTVAFQVLDPAELDFNFDKPTLFEDMESGRDLYLDPVKARAGYLEKLKVHNDAVRSTCEKLGVAFQSLRTDQPLELALYDFMRNRGQGGRIVRQVRRGSA